MLNLKTQFKNKELFKASFSFYENPKLEEQEGRPFLSDAALLALIGGIILILF